MVTLFLIKEAKIYNGEKTVSSISSAGKSGQLHVKECNQNIFYTILKKNSNWIKDLHIRPETTKLLDENISSTLSDLSLSNIFFDLSPQAMKTKAKINKWDLIKLKSFYTAKENTDKTKSQLLNGRRHLKMIKH